MESTKDVKGSKGRAVKASLFAAALMVPTTIFATAGPSGAGQLAYSMTTQSRAFEAFEQFPYEINQGSPSTTVVLDLQGFESCETISGLVDGGPAEELATLFSGQVYKNPTKVRAGNQRGSLPNKAEFGAAPGPQARAECPTASSGTGTASWGGYVSDEGAVESAMSKSTATRGDSAAPVDTETVTKLQGVKIGEVRVANLESWVNVKWRPEQEPLISYRLFVSGLFNGADPVFLNGEHGLVLQGQNLAGSEFVKQFNTQAKAHANDLEQLGTYGFRVLEPRVYKSPSTGRDIIESFMLEAGFGLAARKGEQIGNFQGIRLASARITGKISSFG